jgi:hypothetical protein
MDREAALADFQAARSEWETAFGRVPDEALAYLKPGDDYALGGLQVHVNWVLVRYNRVLEAVIRGGFGPVPPPESAAEVEDVHRRAGAGLTGPQRTAEVALMDELHSKVIAAVGTLPAGDWDRKAPVVYGDGQDPYPTSPEDLVGWLRDHYREHVQQSADLIAEWEGAGRPKR